MSKTPRQLYERVRERPNACSLAELEALLSAYGFFKKERGHVQVWALGHITLTFHKPHQKRGRIKSGAVYQTLSMIDEAISLGLAADDPPID